MNCEKVKELAQEFHDGALVAPLEQQIKAHVAACVSCCLELDRLRALSEMLRQIPRAPSSPAALEAKLMRAFRQKHAQPVVPTAWWRGIFVGSLTISKPAFAGALVVVAVAIVAANIIGRNTAFTLAEKTFSFDDRAVSPAPPQIIEQTKFVEVPVERIVTKIVYVEKETSGAEKVRSRFGTPRRKGLDRSGRNVATKAGDSNFPMQDSVAENGYFTRTNLTGFEPSAEMKPRIIREVKIDEK